MNLFIVKSILIPEFEGDLQSNAHGNWLYNSGESANTFQMLLAQNNNKSNANYKNKYAKKWLKAQIKFSSFLQIFYLAGVGAINSNVKGFCDISACEV